MEGFALPRWLTERGIGDHASEQSLPTFYYLLRTVHGEKLVI